MDSQHTPDKHERGNAEHSSFRTPGLGSRGGRPSVPAAGNTPTQRQAPDSARHAHARTDRAELTWVGCSLRSSALARASCPSDWPPASSAQPTATPPHTQSAAGAGTRHSSSSQPLRACAAPNCGR
eukprot:3897229-Rhodomonas_salina.2